MRRFRWDLFAEFDWGTHQEPAAIEVPASPPSAAASPGRQRPQLDELVATVLARPLFNPTRHPSERAAHTRLPPDCEPGVGTLSRNAGEGLQGARRTL